MCVCLCVVVVVVVVVVFNLCWVAWSSVDLVYRPDDVLVSDGLIIVLVLSCLGWSGICPCLGLFSRFRSSVLGGLLFVLVLSRIILSFFLIFVLSWTAWCLSSS